MKKDNQRRFQQTMNSTREFSRREKNIVFEGLCVFTLKKREKERQREREKEKRD
jgi:hypothetical protein